MNRYLIEKNIGKARDVLKNEFNNGKAKKMLRSKMSAFGAVVLMSGPLPAIAYYADNEPMIVKLLAAMYENTSADTLFTKIRTDLQRNRMATVETLLAYSVSLKMAFNLLTLTETTGDNP